MKTLTLGTAYQELPFTSGTLQNQGEVAITITDDTATSGQTVEAGQSVIFHDTVLYAKAESDTEVVIAPFALTATSKSGGGVNKQLNLLQRNKAYAVGDIAYSADLPSWAYLECTTAGTTDSSDVSLSGMTEGDSVADGTVVWVVRRVSPIYTGLNHNGIYRGKYIGTFASVAEIESFLSTHKVSTGEFIDLYIGDYFVLQDGTYNKAWEIAGFDTYLHKGDTELGSHHLALIPKENLTTSYMNSTNTTEGGYYNSYMHQTVMPAVNSNLANVLGSHLLTRRALLSNSISTSIASGAGAGWTGAANNWNWYDVKACLMSEVAVYGTRVFSSSFYDVSEDCERLPIFHFKGHSYTRQWHWLRAVASGSNFAVADYHGFATYSVASTANGGVRPLICVG